MEIRGETDGGHNTKASATSGGETKTEAANLPAVAGEKRGGQETAPAASVEDKLVRDVEQGDCPRAQDEEDVDEEEEDSVHESVVLIEGGDPFQGGYKDIEDKSCWFKVRIKNKYLKWAELALNPIVTILALLLIIGFVTITIHSPAKANKEFGSWKAWIGSHFTWMYIGAVDVWAVFIIYILFSKYSSIKLGKPDSKPEFNDATWFTMLFSCGVSTGLFFFGVAEPVLHYTTDNRYSADPTLPDNKLGQEALNITLYHWGIHGWVIYTLVGLLLSLMAHREGLPLTLKSCFYPLIGDKVFGWPGDLIDVMSVIATMFGVCTSLGLGTIQMNGGIHQLIPSIPISTNTQVVIIWIITAVATFSVVTGMKNGIRRLSEFCFLCGLALMFSVLFLDNTVFLLNLYVQSMGYYFQWLIQLGFHSDAFERLGPSPAIEDRGRILPDAAESADGPEQWMDLWTMFYWGWWIAWCPFVGMFIAKISYGRTIKEFILGTLAAPVIYVLMWMVIFGGAGIRMERDAAERGICCHNVNVSQFLSNGTSVAFDRDSISHGAWCIGSNCNDCSMKLLTEKVDEGMTIPDIVDEMKSVGIMDWGYTTQNRSVTRLSCRKVERMWFDLMMSYGDLGNFLCGFSMVSLVLYFVTSMDSGSLVIDCLASNGHPEPPTLQRIGWAMLEGLVATALLVAGGEKSLNALQTVSITTGLLYLMLICLSCLALLRALRVAAGDSDPDSPGFAMDILDPFMSDPLKELTENWELTKTKLGYLPKLVINLVKAPFCFAFVSSQVSGSQTFLPYLFTLGVSLLLSVALVFINRAFNGAWVLALVTYLGYALLASFVRKAVRRKFDIPGNPLEDFFLCVFAYPVVALQVDITVKAKQPSKEDLAMKEQHSVLSYDKNPIIKNSKNPAAKVNGNCATA